MKNAKQDERLCLNRGRRNSQGICTALIPRLRCSAKVKRKHVHSKQVTGDDVRGGGFIIPLNVKKLPGMRLQMPLPHAQRQREFTN